MKGETGDVPTAIKKINNIKNKITGTIQYAFLLHKNFIISTKKFFLFIYLFPLAFVVLLRVLVKYPKLFVHIFLLVLCLLAKICILLGSLKQKDLLGSLILQD